MTVNKEKKEKESDYMHPGYSIAEYEGIIIWSVKELHADNQI